MWICLNNSFLSIVADRHDKNQLLVRARLEGHIENIFPEAKVFSKPGSDYLYRAFISREDVAKVMADKVMDINYDNFKNSVKNKPLHDAYLGFWRIMVTLQDRLDKTFSTSWVSKVPAREAHK